MNFANTFFRAVILYSPCQAANSKEMFFVVKMVLLTTAIGLVVPEHVQKGLNLRMDVICHNIIYVLAFQITMGVLLVLMLIALVLIKINKFRKLIK